MTNSSKKIEIFQKIIQESGLFVNLKDALASLKDQLTDNDEANVEIIENWIEELPDDHKENILEEYEHYLLNVEMLGRDGQSSTQSGQQTEFLIKSIENATAAAEPTPKKEDTQSSP